MIVVSAASRLLTRLVESTVNERVLAVTRIVIATSALLKLFLFLPLLARLDEEEIPLPPPVPLPDVEWAVVATLWALAALLLLIGVAVPLTAGLLSACAWYTLLLDERSYSNHLLLLALLATFLALTQGGRLRGEGRHVRSVGGVLLMTQVSTMYAFAGLAKINDSFLSGEVFRGDVALNTALVSLPIAQIPDPLLAGIAIATLTLEFGIGVALWSPRFQSYAFLAGALFHVSIALTMSNPLGLLCFGMLSASVYPLFWSWCPGPAGGDTPQTRQPNRESGASGPR